MNKLLKFLKYESGTTAMEYGLIAFLIATVISVAVTAASNSISNLFNMIMTEILAVI